jgi:hypothetical protein
MKTIGITTMSAAPQYMPKSSSVSFEAYLST